MDGTLAADVDPHAAMIEQSHARLVVAGHDVVDRPLVAVPQ
jgi:hypothetical protein